MSSKNLQKKITRTQVVEKLHELMQKHSLTAVQMANYLRLSKSAFYRLLMGDTVSYPPYVLTLIEYFEINPPQEEIPNTPNNLREAPSWTHSSS